MSVRHLPVIGEGIANDPPPAGEADGTLSAHLLHIVCGAWIERAFRGFTVSGDNRARFLSTLATYTQRVVTAFVEAGAEPSRRRVLAETLVSVCGWIDDGNVWHEDLTLRSYVDVSIAVRALRAFVDCLSAVTAGPGGALDLTRLVLEWFPDSRPALLVHSELLLERGEVDAAIECVQRALRIQAVCQSAQRLLFRAWHAKRDLGSTAPGLDVLDYDLSDRFCSVPFENLSTGWKGAAFACRCPAWLPYPIGNVLEARSVEELWNSDAALEIRRSILDGDFSHCSRTLCTLINARKLPARSEVTQPLLRGYIDSHTTRLSEAPIMVDLNYDTTCNLACPSCRTEILSATREEQAAYATARDRVILPLLARTEGRAYISGGGEAFASKHYRAILRALNRTDYPGLVISLITNGQLLTPEKWSEFPHLAEMLTLLSVSVDAARAETYERLRPPASWAALMRNLEFIAELRRSKKIPRFGLNFVVQRANYQEMLEFTALGARLGVDRIWFQRVVNYGAYDEATFADVDVTSPSHPEHGELLAILREPIMRTPAMDVNMLMSLLPDVFADVPTTGW